MAQHCLCSLLLKENLDLGLKFKPDSEKGFECYCDVDYLGNWNKEFTPVGPSTAMSQKWLDSNLFWMLYLMGIQTPILSCAIYYQGQVYCHVTSTVWRHPYCEPTIGNEGVRCTKPDVYCKVFEDNLGALELARLPKLYPRTKQINICCHHFCKHAHMGLIKIFPIDTKD